MLLADNYEEDGAQKLLMTLPGMTEPIADAILDWIDPDSDQRTLGAEQEYYSSLSPPYAPRNGPLGSIEELLLVRDVTPALLFGADLNRNGLIEANEQPYTDDRRRRQLHRHAQSRLGRLPHDRQRRAEHPRRRHAEDRHQHARPARNCTRRRSRCSTKPMANFIVAYRQGGPEDEDGEPTGQTVSRRQPARSISTCRAASGCNSCSTWSGVRDASRRSKQAAAGPEPSRRPCESPFRDEPVVDARLHPQAVRQFFGQLVDRRSPAGSTSTRRRERSCWASPAWTADAVDQIIASRHAGGRTASGPSRPTKPGRW